MTPPAFDATLTASRPLSPGVRSLVFARVDGTPFDFEAGQWVSLLVPTSDGELRRSYSIASAPDGGPAFELAVTRVDSGKGSNALHALAVGDTLRVIGPQGFFTRAAPPGGEAPPTLFVGTGTGLAPLRSMIRASVGAAVPMALLFGGRTEADLLYRDELTELAARHPGFAYAQTLSQGSDGWAGRRGYVQAHARTLYDELAARSPTPPHVYVCGLEKMVSAVRTLFRQELGLPRQLVHSERYD
jgi:ferredoxin-NADP reductase